MHLTAQVGDSEIDIVCTSLPRSVASTGPEAAGNLAFDLHLRIGVADIVCDEFRHVRVPRERRVERRRSVATGLSDQQASMPTDWLRPKPSLAAHLVFVRA
jgi:hypothetical protein